MPEDHQNERPKSPPEGDDRTPDKTIGQVKYAAGQEKPQQGATGKPQASNLEPEKQGSQGPDAKARPDKAGLQDDHDPRDPAQKQNDQPTGAGDGDKKQGVVPPDGDTQGGGGSQGGM